jgi:hypothetical protein
VLTCFDVGKLRGTSASIERTHTVPVNAHHLRWCFSSERRHSTHGRLHPGDPSMRTRVMIISPVLRRIYLLMPPPRSPFLDASCSSCPSSTRSAQHVWLLHAVAFRTRRLGGDFLGRMPRGSHFARVALYTGRQTLT